MTAKERIEAIRAITEFLTNNSTILSDEEYRKCVQKIMQLISML